MFPKSTRKNSTFMKWVLLLTVGLVWDCIHIIVSRLEQPSLPQRCRVLTYMISFFKNCIPDPFKSFPKLLWEASSFYKMGGGWLCFAIWGEGLWTLLVSSDPVERWRVDSTRQEGNFLEPDCPSWMYHDQQPAIHPKTLCLSKAFGHLPIWS